ncbi:MAG: CYTH domain-containing protein [Muribaculaceae bacterium]|nr:CYTH domain-containing protein [Muribaculaceae bacterium]
MAREIERKFLVEGDFMHEAFAAQRITQGFLSSVPERVVRIRIKGDKGYITIKGMADAAGVSRYEWEKEIPVEEARELLLLCEPGVIDKTRYLVEAGDYTFEVDVFHGENEGLIVAEIELPDEDAPFQHPSWLGREVTGDSRYYNVMLAKHPFKTWE